MSHNSSVAFKSGREQRTLWENTHSIVELSVVHCLEQRKPKAAALFPFEIPNSSAKCDSENIQVYFRRYYKYASLDAGHRVCLRSALCSPRAFRPAGTLRERHPFVDCTSYVLSSNKAGNIFHKEGRT